MSQPNVPYLRTPDERFQHLPNFQYEPHYIQYGNLRIAYVDEATGDSSEVFLCLHGQPMWSYLYRKMIPMLLKHTTLPTQPSRRVVAPDLLGFGRSDKPTRDEDYTFNLHRDSLLHLIKVLDLTNITLVVGDWGGLLGLTLPIADPTRFKRLIVMNTTIAVGTELDPSFYEWRAFNNSQPDLQVGQLCRKVTPHLSQEEADAYDAPFPNQDFKAGVRRFPNLVMVTKDMQGVAVSEKSLALYQASDMFRDTDIFMACGMQDGAMGPPAMEPLSKVWKNGCYYVELPEAGHLVQEWGKEVARMAIEVFEKQGKVEGVRRIESAGS